MAIALVLAGCAARLGPGDVYRSDKGYRVSLPGQGWRVVRESRADLELRHRLAPAAMLVNASCDGRLAARPLPALRRELLAGVSERQVQEQGTVAVAGREAVHMVVDGQVSGRDRRVRLELYVLKADRCVYDLLYVAPPADFSRWREDFQRLVETFMLE
jgi:hypothetical protein